jgi:shikimate kinase
VRIALLGYMGSGKTTVGTLLAEHLRLPFVDLDNVIEQQEQLSIADLFKMKGEDYFRSCEAKAVRALLTDSTAFVLATGGGTPCFFDNMKLLNEQSSTIYLDCDASIIHQRIASSESARPLFLSDINELQQHLSSRISFYSMAHYTISNNSSAVDACNSILEKIGA